MSALLITLANDALYSSVLKQKSNRILIVLYVFVFAGKNSFLTFGSEQISDKSENIVQSFVTIIIICSSNHQCEKITIDYSRHNIYLGSEVAKLFVS